MPNDEMQRQKNLARIEEIQNELVKSAKIRKIKEQTKKANKKIDVDKIKDKYITKHYNMNKDELLFRLDIVDEIVNLINN